MKKIREMLKNTSKYFLFLLPFLFIINYSKEVKNSNKTVPLYTNIKNIKDIVIFEGKIYVSNYVHELIYISDHLVPNSTANWTSIPWSDYPIIE